MADRTSRVVLLCAGVTVVLWASAFVGIRMVGTSLAPGPLALGRMLAGSATLSAVLAVRTLNRRRPSGAAGLLPGGRPSGLRLPRGRLLLGAAAWGVAWFGLYNLLLNTAERRIDAGTTALMVNSAPILVAVLGGLLLGEGFPRRLLLGLGIAFVGVALVAATSWTGAGDLLGVLLALGAAALYAVGATSQKVLLARVDALTLTWLGALVGTAALLPYIPRLAGEIVEAPAATVVAVVCLGVFPTGVAFLTWAYALARTTAGRLAVATYACPAVVVLLSWLVLGELPAALALVGGVTCLVGVAVATVRRPARRPDTSDVDLAEHRQAVVAGASEPGRMTDTVTPPTIARSTSRSTPRSTARDSLDRWLTMWNGDGGIARQICADDFRIHFAVTEQDGSTPADDIRTAEDFARYLDWWHRQHPGVVFTLISDAIDGEHGRLLWDVEADGGVAGGVDVFDFAEDGRVRRVWSVGGRRSMRS